ncbi:putative octanoyltransferase [Neolecta irregularis DAH-3]|uniref:Octanoyltransferase n=1 Tax=Neolecta irregularis (strain DAH-3) TaxID=1198029 RepID=A0A1U7LG43_NEOID|nr:putative octanoyltransferase [Neolecta irregularis DAH-3]|eukprot:OLL21626.1 putative octanoyltransferase [Neolecta irregularis DAH-3]
MALLHVPLPSPMRYLTADAIQARLVSRNLVAKASTSGSPGGSKNPQKPILLTLELQPTFTSGLTAPPIDPALHAKLKALPAEIFTTRRGGGITFHGPGQLLAFPVLDLTQFQLKTRSYVYMLESALLETCGYFGIPTRITNNVGLWVSKKYKIASIGIHIRRHITSHGIALNVSTDLDKFGSIVPCGLRDTKMTSFHQLGVQVSVDDAARVFALKIAGQIGLRVETVDYKSLFNPKELHEFEMNEQLSL